MKYRISQRLVKFFHNVRIGFNKLFIILGIVTIGTGLLSIYTIFRFIDTMQWAYKVNPAAVNAALLAIIAVPLISYAMERFFTTYMQKNSK